jgi:two-component system nitrogen regulation sensor histidine kinase NtrY
MAIQAPTLNEPLFRETGAKDSRRLLALPGVVAVAGALVTAAISFAILVGATPIVPNERRRWRLSRYAPHSSCSDRAGRARSAG